MKRQKLSIKPIRPHPMAPIFTQLYTPASAPIACTYIYARAPCAQRLSTPPPIQHEHGYPHLHACNSRDMAPPFTPAPAPTISSYIIYYAPNNNMHSLYPSAITHEITSTSCSKGAKKKGIQHTGQNSEEEYEESTKS